MEERKTLHKLVVIMMSDSPPMPARELYDEVKKQPVNFYEERIRSFRGFVKIINSFPEIGKKGSVGENKLYFLKKSRF